MSDSNLRKNGSKESSTEERYKRVTLAAPQAKEELAVSTPNQRNWRGILIALLVIVAVLGLIVCSIALLSPPDEGPRVRGSLFTLDNIIGNQFIPNLFNGTWITESMLVYRNEYDGISVLCVENFTTRALMTNLTFRQINAVDFRVSADLNFVLLLSDVKKVWKHSVRAKYTVYEVLTQEHFPLTPFDDDDIDSPHLDSVLWTPTGNGLVFVYNNDIYYKQRVKKPPVLRLTRTGTSSIFNGRPDFLYENKVLESSQAMWFSPDSKYLMFTTFNCSRVGLVQYPYYGNNIYEEIRSVRYPKSGTNNPQVTLSVAPLDPKYLQVKQVQPAAYFQKQSDYYITGAAWINNNSVSVSWMNRRQNLTSVSVCKHPTWICTDNYRSSSPNYWVNKISNPIYDRDGSRALVLLPINVGEKGEFQHVGLVYTSTNKYLPLTKGPITALEILAWDLESNYVYFLSTTEPGQRHLFRVSSGLDEHTRKMECLTCYIDHSNHNRTYIENIDIYCVANTSMDNSSTPKCLFSKIYFNSVYNPKFYVLECLGPEVPSSVLVEVSTNTIVQVLDSNSRLQNKIDLMAVPQIKTFQVEVVNGYQAQVRLYLPPGLREFDDLIYPLILHVNGAPGSQLVNEKFQVNWFWYLATHKNYIIAEIDGRGSGYQGEKMIHELKNRIGSVEVEDQLSVVMYLKDNLKFIDKQRIGVYGVNHGGYLAGIALSEDEHNIFQCGVAVNPVTNLAYCDTFTTERYMGTPNVTDNYRAYEDSDLTKRKLDLEKKEFLLVSSVGNVDVSFQHSMKLVRALVDEKVFFKHQIYPDEDNDLHNVLSHYYQLVEQFWDECFSPMEIEEEWEIDPFTPFTRE